MNCYTKEILDFVVKHDELNYVVQHEILNFGYQDTAAPTNFLLTAGDGEIVLSWNGWHEFYEIERSLDGINFTLLASTTNTTYTDSTTTNGVTYYYRLRAYETTYSCYTEILNDFSGAYPILLDTHEILLDGFTLTMGGA